MTVEVRVGHIHACHDLAFEPFHFLSLCVGLVVVADEVKKAMHCEMGEMMDKLPIFIVAFPLERLESYYDVTKKKPVVISTMTGCRK